MTRSGRAFIERGLREPRGTPWMPRRVKPHAMSEPVDRHEESRRITSNVSTTGRTRERRGGGPSSPVQVVGGVAGRGADLLDPHPPAALVLSRVPGLEAPTVPFAHGDREAMAISLDDVVRVTLAAVADRAGGAREDDEDGGRGRRGTDGQHVRVADVPVARE